MTVGGRLSLIVLAVAMVAFARMLDIGPPFVMLAVIGGGVIALELVCLVLDRRGVR